MRHVIIIAGLLALALPRVAGAQNGLVAGEAPKTADQLTELANLKILAGRALFNSGQLRDDVVKLTVYWAGYITGYDAKLADLQTQVADLKANPAHAVAAATKPGMLFIVTPDGLGLRPATPEEIRKAAGPAPVAKAEPLRDPIDPLTIQETPQ